jgi:SAM-dependent methyltransferase
MTPKALLIAYNLLKFSKPVFQCPICNYRGRFMNLHAPTGLRWHAKCPSCGALERHRLQSVVLKGILAGKNTPAMRVLHFAPEPFLKAHFSNLFGRYETADLSMPGVDLQFDIQRIPLPDSTFDMLFACHVLEHVPDDSKAIAELRRILKPDGIAFLPVPIVTQKTVEYKEPNPNESFHVRAPGLDYFDRLRAHFERVDIVSSEDVDESCQPFVYARRPLPSETGCSAPSEVTVRRSVDYIPVCFCVRPGLRNMRSA